MPARAEQRTFERLLALDLRIVGIEPETDEAIGRARLARRDLADRIGKHVEAAQLVGPAEQRQLLVERFCGEVPAFPRLLHLPRPDGGGADIVDRGEVGQCVEEEAHDMGIEHAGEIASRAQPGRIAPTAVQANHHDLDHDDLPQ